MFDISKYSNTEMSRHNEMNSTKILNQLFQSTSHLTWYDIVSFTLGCAVVFNIRCMYGAPIHVLKFMMYCTGVEKL